MAERSIVESLAPVFTLVVALAAALAPVMPSAHSPVGPHWLLVTAAFWAQRRPGLTPAPLLFPFLLVYEMLRDGPLGIELLAVLVVAETLAFAARRYPTYSFMDEWVRFGSATFAMEALLWLVLAAAYVTPPTITTLLTRWGAGLLAYLLLSLTLGRLRVARRGGDDADSGPRGFAGGASR